LARGNPPRIVWNVAWADQADRKFHGRDPMVAFF